MIERVCVVLANCIVGVVKYNPGWYLGRLMINLMK